jgi:hypothetical protein
MTGSPEVSDRSVAINALEFTDPFLTTCRTSVTRTSVTDTDFGDRRKWHFAVVVFSKVPLPSVTETSSGHWHEPYQIREYMESVNAIPERRDVR